MDALTNLCCYFLLVVGFPWEEERAIGGNSGYLGCGNGMVEGRSNDFLTETYQK
jgi:hypothetical protein